MLLIEVSLSIVGIAK